MSNIREITQLRQDIQKIRVGFGNRVSAIERGADPSGDTEKALFERYHSRLIALEQECNQDIVAEIKAMDMPIFRRIMAIKGIAAITAAKIISPIDITRADTISALWRYAGYGVVEGKREKPIKGEKLHYNRDLKIAVRLAVESFIKCGSPYADLYRTEKEKFAATHPEATKMHCHNAAIGKAAKVFLSHLWQVWRQLEGLPMRELFAVEKLGHSHTLKPEAFGWCVGPECDQKKKRGRKAVETLNHAPLATAVSSD